MTPALPPPKLLKGTRCYLSGPMDFVASRADEQQYGWRNRVGAFLRRFGVTVFDPWEKPGVRGFHEYGIENDQSADLRKLWTFDEHQPAVRSECASKFWPMLHVDLRMVDTSDFVIAYCPTNIYSVGTPHEIIVARQQKKPVLFVSPRVHFGKLGELERHLTQRNDAEGLMLLTELKNEVPIKENPTGAPSLWYLPLVGTDRFFDGFGFDDYRQHFDTWEDIRLDGEERARKPVRPLLKFLEQLNDRLPERWNRHLQKMEPDDDWLIWELAKDS